MKQLQILKEFREHVWDVWQTQGLGTPMVQSGNLTGKSDGP